MAREIYNPHDLFLKATLSSPQAIQDFFESAFPPELQQRVNPASIKLTQTSYVSPALKELRNDLVFACQIDGKPGYLYLLLEHQSKPDRRLSKGSRTRHPLADRRQLVLVS